MKPLLTTLVMAVTLLLAACNPNSSPEPHDGWIVASVADRKDGTYQSQQIIDVWSNAYASPFKSKLNCSVEHGKKAIRISDGWRFWIGWSGTVKVMSLQESPTDYQGNCYGYVNRRNWAERK